MRSRLFTVIVCLEPLFTEEGQVHPQGLEWVFWASQDLSGEARPASVRGSGSIPGLEGSQRRRWHPTPGFLLGEPHGRGAWRAPTYGIAKSRTRLSD